MTNLVLGVSLLTMVSTNWMPILGDWKREGGTNYVQERLVVVTNTYVVETKLCISSNLFSSTQATNGPTRWEPKPLSLLPGVPTKE